MKVRLASKSFQDRLVREASLPEIIRLMNKRHCTISVGSKMAVTEHVPGRTLKLYPYEQFVKRYRWIKKIDPDSYNQLRSIATIWLDSARADHREGEILFAPPGSERRVSRQDFNTWSGFAITPRKGDWSLLRKHLRDVICHGNREWYEYLRKYLAHMMQKPGELPGVAIVLRGKVGVGKTSLYRWVSRLLPRDHCILIDDPDKLTGHFNNHLQSKLWVCADEAFFAGDRSKIGKLQSLITGETMLLTPKGLDTFEIDNYMRLLIASNSPQVVHAHAKERRYFILEVKDTYQKDLAYFDSITAQMRDCGAPGMLYDLLNDDIVGYKPKQFPDTPWMNEQKGDSLEPHARWLRERLDNGTWAERVPKAVFHESYLLYAKKQGARVRYPIDQGDLTRYLRDVFGPGVEYRSGSGPRQYRFPPSLALCRQLFDAHHDLTTGWSSGRSKGNTPESEHSED